MLVREAQLSSGPWSSGTALLPHPSPGLSGESSGKWGPDGSSWTLCRQGSSPGPDRG